MNHKLKSVDDTDTACKLLLFFILSFLFLFFYFLFFRTFVPVILAQATQLVKQDLASKGFAVCVHAVILATIVNWVNEYKTNKLMNRGIEE